jgi:molybdopterin converting factor subunit 1
MTLTLLFFAGLRDQVGRDTLAIDLPGPAKVSVLIQRLEAELPGFSMDGVRVAVNETFTNSDELLHGGETVAFIPPVSGG